MGVLDVLCFSSLSAAHCSPSRMGYRWEARSCSTAAQYCRLLSIALPLELARVVCGNGAGVLPRPLHAACLFVCVVCLGCCRLPASARVGDTDSCSRGEVSLHRLCRVSCLRAFFRRGRTTGFCFGLRVRVCVCVCGSFSTRFSPADARTAWKPCSVERQLSRFNEERQRRQFCVLLV